MKLRIALFLVAVLLLICPVFAAEKPEWSFDSIEKLKMWTDNSQMLQYEIKNGKCEFVPMGKEPYISYTLDADEAVDLSFYDYVAIRINCDAAGYKVKLIIETSDGFYETEFNLYGDLEWHGYMTEVSGVGKVKNITLYLISEQYADIQAHILIDRIGLFEDTERADYFLERSIATLKEKIVHFKPSGMDSPKSLFLNSSDIAKWDVTGEAFNEIGFLRILNVSDGIGITKSMSVPFQSKEFPYFAIRYKTGASSDTAYVSFNDDYQTRSYFILENDGEWHNFIVDMSKYSHRKWHGDIEQIKIFFENSEEISLERTGFFSNYNDASLFLQESSHVEDFTLGKVYKSENYKITVLPGIMNESYVIDDILAENISEALGSDTTVVLLDGVPIVMSDISDRGYVVYHAAGKGRYTIGSYYKEYNDTYSHWAKEYIDYVSARTLFSGTTPTEFSPDMTVTRGMFLTVLGRMHGVDTALFDGYSEYSDVIPTEYYSPYINWAKLNGIFSLEQDCFYPESPISRGEMALAVSNYISFCGYTFGCFAPYSQFSDIGECSTEIQNAILKIQALSIVNGKSPTTFDPHGVSTRAEAAAVMTRLIKSVLGVYYMSPFDSEYFSGDKIRIGAYANFDLDILNKNILNSFVGAGFNMMLMSNELAESEKRDMTFDFCDKNGISVIMPDTALSANINSLSYYERPSFYATLLANEVGSEEFENIADGVKIYNAQMGDKIPLVNLLPLYSSQNQLKYGDMADYPAYYECDYEEYHSYCVRFAETVDSNTFMFNVMPYTSDGLYSKYVESVAIAAKVAIDNDKELWCMIQSDSSIIDRNGFLRQYYTLLSFGCKNFILWLWTEGLCNAYGEFTPAYYAASSANEELRAISDVFIQYENIATVVYNSSQNYSNQYFDIQTQTPEIVELVSDVPVLTGVFRKDDGKSGAFTLLNISETQSVRIKLKLVYDTAVSYFNGMPEGLSKDSDGYFTIELLPGQGVFITAQ